MNVSLALTISQRAALNNIQIVLRAANSDLSHIVKATIYLTNLERDFQPMNEVYAQVWLFAIGMTGSTDL